MAATLSGHAGTLGLTAMRAHGVRTMFTLSGAHVFPFYDAATKARPPMRLVDVRHEQSAVFAAEATGKLTRAPGLAVLTAGPGVTNGVTAIAQAQASGVPMLVVGGRAPTSRWGSGALQEMDHPPLLRPLVKMAATAPSPGSVPLVLDEALRVAAMAHRGPTFVDIPMDELFSHAEMPDLPSPPPTVLEPAEEDLDAVARALRAAERPVLVLGSDVWLDGAERAARLFAETLRLPVIVNGMGRGLLPRGHELLMSKARSHALSSADLVVVAGTPLDFRMQYGRFGGADGRAPAAVVHLADSPGQLAIHADLAASAAGDLAEVFEGVLDALEETQPSRETRDAWLAELVAARALATGRDAELLTADAADGLHPARVYGELLPLLTDDTVVIGDGGDFVSWAGKFIEPARPGNWLDPGPFGALGAGLGAAIGAAVARPDSPIVLLLGDGAAGFSLAELDTLVRHRLPVTLVLANNGAWGLEKHPMRFLYGYDVAADLSRETRYDAVARAFGARGEMVAAPDELAGALDRALSSGEPSLVNVLLDPEVAYPRQTTGV